jgi:uncharacterized membrane protein YoaK (UPF0700 family)
MNAFTKKIATGTLAALTLGVTLAASSAPAEARWGRNAAFFGGLAAGAIVAGAASHAYAAPRYYASPVYYGGSCWVERRAVYNSWGDFAGYRRIRVCN